MNLAKFYKAEAERKRYAIDYTDWLDTGETVSSVSFAVSPSTGTSPLEIDANSISVDGLQVVFFAALGDNGVTYTVTATIQTSGGQVKEDGIVFVVKGA